MLFTGQKWVRPIRVMDEPTQIMTRYLLGELSEQEQAALEEKYFADPQAFDQVLKIESELVDGYARGQLSNEMRERFEKSYLAHPARSERAKFAAALATGLNRIEESTTRIDQPTLPTSWWQKLLTSFRGQRPTLRLSIALATLLIMLGGGWLFVQSRRRQQQRELAQTQANRENQERRVREQQAAQQQPAQTPQHTEKPPDEEERVAGNPQQKPQPSPNPTINAAPPVVSLALNVGMVRGGDDSRTQTLTIPQGTTQAQLLLNLKDNSYPGYRVSLQMIGGAEIFSRSNIKPRGTKSGASFSFTLPARDLASGDYVLTLSGISAEGEVDALSKSLFRVEKR